MRTFNLKGELLVPNPYNADVEPGRTIDAEPLRMTEPRWVQQNYASGERAVRRECDVEDDERRPRMARACAGGADWHLSANIESRHINGCERNKDVR